MAEEKKDKITQRPIVEEMQQSYLDYAMSVIVSRALPDVRDGLKPVHRRILYAMYRLGLTSDSRFRKSAMVVGEVLGKYHPHSDTAVYDSLVRMAQDFSLRYPLVRGQGNFGCFTEDTKIRLTDGRDISFKNLVKESRLGKRHWGFSFNLEKEEIEIAEIKKPRLTRKNEELVELTLDNGEKIRCTLDHLFMTRDGSYKPAKDLKETDSLMPLYISAYQGKEAKLTGYEVIRQPIKNVQSFVHRLADRWNLDNNIYDKSNNIFSLGSNPACFKDFSQIISASKEYNHRIVKKRFLKKREDVYDLTIEPHHNFALTAGVFVHNSLDGDKAASMRYSEAKLEKISNHLLEEIDKETVKWMPNYDNSRQEPTVLPARFPNLLLTGSIGIAVGMATNIPPHNLSEVIDATVAILDKPTLSPQEIMEFIPGPDFPTGGSIYDKKAIAEAYNQGRGSFICRAKAEIEENGRDGYQIIISEIVWQVNKAQLVEKIADLVKTKKISGIKSIRDESNREGVRVVIELKKNFQPKRVLNRLYKLTDLQKTYHLNLLALVDGIQPQVLSIKEILEKFIDHRLIVVKKRSEFELKQAEDRAHILEGFSKAIKNIEAVIATIKASKDKNLAKVNLIKKFKFSDIQAEEILKMRLQALAGLERKKVEDELKEKKKLIEELKALISSPAKIKKLVKKELLEIKDKYGDERRTQVFARPLKSIGEEELIQERDVIVVITKDGYIKRSPVEAYRQQKRAGLGVSAITTKEEDLVKHFFVASTTDSLLFFTNKGKVLAIKTYEVPEGSRTSKGKPIVNLMELGADDKITATLVVKKEHLEDKDNFHIVMATQNGIIKKTPVSDFANIRKSGIRAIRLKQGDVLGWAKLSQKDAQILIVTKKGQSIKFNSKEVRPMGRNSAGVHGIRLKEDDIVRTMTIVSKGEKRSLLVLSENGLGKKTKVDKFRIQKRGGSGIKAMNVTKKTGDLAGAVILSEEENLIVISTHGKVIRVGLKNIPVLGRNTQGVKIMRLKEGDSVADFIIF